MKTNSYKHIVLKLFVVSSFILLFSSQKSFAQEGAYWMGLSTKNPAAIGTPSDWLFGTYHQMNYPYGQKLEGYGFFVDTEISPRVGTVGLSYMNEKFDDSKTTLIELSYAYTFKLSDAREIHVGISGGLNRNEDGFSGYSTIPEVDINEGSKLTLLKTGFGTYYNSRKLEAGISYNFYNEMKSNLNAELDYSMLKSLTVLSAYRFFILDEVVIEPNVLFDFREEDSDCYLSLHFTFDNMIWAGFSSKDWNELFSLNFGIDIVPTRLRLAYSFSFSKRYNIMYDLDKRLTAHEFVLGYRLH